MHNIPRIVLSVLFSIAILCSFLLDAPLAGNREAPAGPSEAGSAMFTLEDIYNRLIDGTQGAKRTGAFIEPSSGPGPTGHTLDEVMAVAPKVDDTNGAGVADVLADMTFWGLTSGAWGTKTGTMTDREGDNNASTAQARSEEVIYFTAPEGYYDGDDRVSATDAQVRALDTNLSAENIRNGVTVFGLDGNSSVVNTSSGDAAADEIMKDKKAWVDGSEVTGTLATKTLSPDSTTVAAGNYAATTLNAVDDDLASANIRKGATIFGVGGDANVVNTGSGDAAAGDIVLNKKAWVDGLEVTGNIGAGGNVSGGDGLKTFNIPNGLYSGKTATANDEDLVASNIKDGVIVFEVTGTYPLAGVAKTGQTTDAGAGSDGNLKKGVAWPTPRFTAATDTVADNLTGLMWAKNANLTGATPVNWQAALDYCNNSELGGYTDWRLPNVNELLSLIDFAYKSPALSDAAGTGRWTTDGDAFIDVQSEKYWTSTIFPDVLTDAYYVNLNKAFIFHAPKTCDISFVWPVRGGQ